MKIIALTQSDPGLRYRAQLYTLSQIPVELICVQVAGPGVWYEKLRRQLRILRRRGLPRYLRWRLDRARAAPSRMEVQERLRRALHGSEALSYEIPVIRSFSGFSRSLVAFIKGERPDFLYQAGAGLIPAHFIAQCPPILNLHPGILPGIRGVEPTFWALFFARKDWLGSTLHIIDKGIDTGPPLLRRRLDLPQKVDYIEILRQQFLMELELLVNFFRFYPSELQQYDTGGASDSVYRSTWTADQFERLRQNGWWGPLAE